MAGDFTLEQRMENARFVEILGRTGNARLAAREIGRKPSTMHHRRGVCAAFAQNWEAAVAAAHARFHLAGGRRGPEAVGGATGSGQAGGGGAAGLGCARPGLSTSLETNGKRGAARRSHSPRNRGEELRTRGGEAVVVRTRTGKLQMRFAQPDKLTKAAEQAFLLALSASANVRLSAAAAGASQAAFYRRRRQDKAFAREWRLALAQGWERLDWAMMAAGLPGSGEHDAWTRCEEPALPPLSVGQVLQLLYLHQKSVKLGTGEAYRRRRAGEPWETYTARVRAMWAEDRTREAEDAALARAARFEASGSWRLEDEPAPPPLLPPLDLITGWSKASGRPPHHPDVAMFGGWRIADMRRKKIG